ncbi:MAG: hypothetical protein U0V70_02460 [Terriglobia bacterium]
MSDASRKSGSSRFKDLTFCYPAPAGLPVPVKPQRGSRESLEAIDSLDWNSVVSSQRAELVRAGAYWLHGFLEESHRIAQGIHSAEGSYWHALMHRSEGDFGNSMYWFRRVGRHAIFPELLGAIKSRPANKPAGQKAWQEIAGAKEWDPQWLVDLCEAGSRGKFDDLNFVQRISALEYDLLMGYCLQI